MFPNDDIDLQEWLAVLLGDGQDETITGFHEEG